MTDREDTVVERRPTPESMRRVSATLDLAETAAVRVLSQSGVSVDRRLRGAIIAGTQALVGQALQQHRKLVAAQWQVEVRQLQQELAELQAEKSAADLILYQVQAAFGDWRRTGDDKALQGRWHRAFETVRAVQRGGR